MRTASRFVVKPGELFGTFEGSELEQRVRKHVTKTEDGAAGVCMLGGTIARGVPATHISGMGMYGEKSFPVGKVVETGIVRTEYVNSKEPDKIEVSAIVRPDWTTLRYHTPKGDYYHETPEWTEFGPVEYFVTLRGLYVEWYRRGKTSFDAKDAAAWCAEKTGRDYLKGPQHVAAIRRLMECNVNVPNAMATMIPYMNLVRAAGRWRCTWIVSWCEHGNHKAAQHAAEWCGLQEQVNTNPGAAGQK